MRVRNWAIAAFVLLAGVVVWLGVGGKAKEKEREQAKVEQNLAAALARAESLGIPVYADHLRQDKIPDEDNAWIEIKSIHDEVYAKRPSPDLSELREAKEKEQFIEIAEVALGFWDEHFVTARVAAQKPAYRPERKWEEGVALLMPDMPSVKELVRALTLQARYDLFMERHSDSLSNLHTAAKIARHVGSEPTKVAALVQSALESIIAKEIVVQAGHSRSREHLVRLQEVLDTLFEQQPVKDRMRAEIVTLVESVRMASSDSVTGNELRDSIKPEDRRKLFDFCDASPEETKVFEAQAINAACDYYEGLIADINSAKHNDSLHSQFIDLPFVWIPDGFPLSYASLYESLYTGGFHDNDGPYAGLARLPAYASIYGLAFEIASGDISLRADVTRVVPGLDGSLLEYAESAEGYEFTASAPSIKPLTLKFDWN